MFHFNVGIVEVAIFSGDVKEMKSTEEEYYFIVLWGFYLPDFLTLEGMVLYL